jgi:hypothetical protein
MKEGKYLDVPDGIIGQRTKQCGGNVYYRHVGVVRQGDLRGQPTLGASGNNADYAAENAVDLEADSYFFSAYRDVEEDIPHTRNN